MLADAASSACPRPPTLVLVLGALGLLCGCGADDAQGGDADSGVSDSSDSSESSDLPSTDETSETETADPTCVDEAALLQLVWPLPGVDALDWAITNYPDLDPFAGLADYVGNVDSLAKTYDGHQGTDISISSFRQMDVGVPVLAAAPGQVELVVDGFEDRHTECINQDANFVSVRHGSGALLHYGHLRTNSTAVSVGDQIEAGDLLGEIGSSGCSDGPHLHFEITDTGGSWVDPFAEQLWCEPPIYDTPMGFMEAWVLIGPEDQYANPLQDPPAEVTQFAVDDLLLAYAVVGGGLPGDELAAQLVGPGGITVGPWPIVLEQSLQLSTFYWAFTVAGPPGEWTVEYLMGGEEVASKGFEVQ